MLSHLHRYISHIIQCIVYVSIVTLWTVSGPVLQQKFVYEVMPAPAPAPAPHSSNLIGWLFIASFYSNLDQDHAICSDWVQGICHYGMEMYYHDYPG